MYIPYAAVDAIIEADSLLEIGAFNVECTFLKGVRHTVQIPSGDTSRMSLR